MIFPLFAGLCSVVQAARVGILDFRSDAAKPTQSFLSQTLPNALAEPLTSQTGITVVERSQLSRLVEEKGLESLSEKVPDSLRTLFPADDLVMGEFAGSLDSLVLQVRVVECATGTVKGAFSRKGSLQEILSGMPGLATQIALAVRGDSSGRLSVSSRPSGANVFLDGTILGRTPLVDQRIPPGRHALSLELDHFQTWTDSVIIEPSATIGRKVELAEDDDRSGIWFGGGGQINGLTRDLGDAAGPSYSGFLSIVGRAQRFGVEI